MNHKALSVQQCRAGHFCAPTLRSGKKNQENHYVVCTYYIILLLQIAHLCSVIKNKNDMEIVTMDHEVVKAMMSKIDRIAAYVFKKENVPKEEPEILLTSEETADLLKISTRTLQRMRKDRTIPYVMMRNKCRYRLADLEECVRTKIVKCNPQTLEEFRRNYLLSGRDGGRDYD